MLMITQTEKKAAKALQDEADEIQRRNGLSIPILPASERDALVAKTTEFTDPALTRLHKRRLAVEGSSIFAKPKPSHNSKGGDIRDTIILNTRRKHDPFLSNHSGAWQGQA